MPLLNSWNKTRSVVNAQKKGVPKDARHDYVTKRLWPLRHYRVAS